jgi:DNA-binding Lrp family transcriptional regulator
MRKKILKILEKDARISPGKIAKMIGEKKENVEREIKEMEKEGIIKRYRTLIDWEKAGEEKVYALIDIKVSPERDVGFDDVARRIYHFPEVKFVYLVSGLYDFSILVEGKNMKEVAAFVSEKLATLERVQNTITHFVLKKYKEEGEILEETKKDKRILFSY